MQNVLSWMPDCTNSQMHSYRLFGYTVLKLHANTSTGYKIKLKRRLNRRIIQFSRSVALCVCANSRNWWLQLVGSSLCSQYATNKMLIVQIKSHSPFHQKSAVSPRSRGLQGGFCRLTLALRFSDTCFHFSVRSFCCRRFSRYQRCSQYSSAVSPLTPIRCSSLKLRGEAA